MDVKAQAHQGGSQIDAREKVKQIMAGCSGFPRPK